MGPHLPGGFRLDGGERGFVALRDEKEVTTLARTVLRTLDEPMSVDGARSRMSAGIGAVAAMWR